MNKEIYFLTFFAVVAGVLIGYLLGVNSGGGGGWYVSTHDEPTPILPKNRVLELN